MLVETWNSFNKEKNSINIFLQILSINKKFLCKLVWKHVVPQISFLLLNSALYILKQNFEIRVDFSETYIDTCS